MVKNIVPRLSSSSSSQQQQEIKHRNDPGRFFGDGVIFKAKLIGILEVGEARGDRMCQEALQDLKMAIRAAGEHKQRITIHVTIDGLRLRDEKTSDSLYHHPVHKISFIAQDMSDSRAFGYIFGSPDSGHRFFGIKTDKAASQVVLAMRDLFQVVFELKKKEIELARQQIQSKTIHEHQPLSLTIKSTLNNGATSSLTTTGKHINIDGAKANIKEMSPESVADLVDLEQELSSLQRGITQMERITPSEPTPTGKSFTEEDPFGDSFTNFPTYNLLPPPESSSRSRHPKPNKPPETIPSISTLLSSQNKPTLNNSSLNTTQSSSSDNWLHELDQSDVFETSSNNKPQESATPNTTASLDELQQAAQQSDSDSFSASFVGADIAAKELAELFDVSSDTFEANHHSSSKGDSDDFGGSSRETTAGINDSSGNKVDDVVVMMARDTDPFSPTRKKSDPFQEGDVFGKLDPFEFEFPKENILPETKIASLESDAVIPRKEATNGVFNGPLQVNLPPESWPTGTQRRMESPTSMINRNRSSVFKQNTVDVISTISSKKMPHLFGQKFSKRDSNSINMRRLQESDSLSENEAAPEPPPRPDSASHIEPPPLPPKKQFSDIVIRPRITSSSAIPPPTKYDYVTAKLKMSSHHADSIPAAPPIPLPSRRVGRSDASYPGPGRPRKPGCDEDDYLTPISSGHKSDVPQLLPPPQTKGRARRQESYENKTENERTIGIADGIDRIIPDITLSQLLTLGIDDLATKLGVPTSKLSTMTLVELTTYLSEFIEKSKRQRKIPAPTEPAPILKQTAAESSPVFKVSFDQSTDATFVAKFDDNFGEDSSSMPFVANFSQFDKPPPKVPQKPQIPPADRYAVFREIIDQELRIDSFEQKSSPEADDPMDVFSSESNVFSDDDKSEPIATIPKLDTKITEAISHDKDRYAALRDIILVDDLFDKQSPPLRPPSETLLPDFVEFNDDFNAHDDSLENDEKVVDDESSPESNPPFEEETLEKSEDNSSSAKPESKFLHTLTVANKDDLEIDELMNRAISNLSLDSRDHLSPNNAKSPISTTAAANADSITSGSPTNLQVRRSPLCGVHLKTGSKSQFNDVSTSPIPIQKSPIPKSPLSKSPISKSPVLRSPNPQSTTVASLIESSKCNKSESLSDIVCGSSPDAGLSDAAPKVSTNLVLNPPESWAIFEKQIDDINKDHKQALHRRLKSPNVPSNKDSPCSSDGKDDWKGDPEYGRRWPKGHTSSSSRDLSPWDDECPDYKKRLPPPGSTTDRHGYYMRHARRMNSCDDDYDYEEEMSKRRERKPKLGISRSRDNFEFESPSWYQQGVHHTWSPQDEESRARSFERGSYDRTTYGPPVYDKREHKISPHGFYDRRDYKSYDKRKYYRDYTRPNYDFEPYADVDGKDRKMMYHGDSFEKPKPRRDYENIYEEGFAREGSGRLYKSREYFYDRDRKSFDRESIESYDSANRRRKSFGSGDVYGSLESREEFRERYMGGGSEKTRSLRKGGGKMHGMSDDYEQDSENDVQMRRSNPTDTRSLQRPPQGPRMRKSSGSSPWDGEEIPPVPPTQKGWKRPSSASESERRLAENRRVLGSHTPSGSDGEKDRRFRKKQRSRAKDLPDPRPARYGPHRDNYDYITYDDYEQQPIDEEDKFERLNRRRHEMHQRMFEAERRKKTSDKYKYEDEIGSPKYLNKKESGNFYPEKDRYSGDKFEVFEDVKPTTKPRKPEFEFNDEFEDPPRPNTSSSKFDFDEHGFESDFNSPPPPPPTTGSSHGNGTVTSNKSFRFSNDFSDKEKLPTHQPTINFESEFTPTPTQKLRFDDKVTISKFENDEPSAFEDDFSKAEFEFEKEDQWIPEQPKKNNLRLTSSNKFRQEMIKKSESVNIFAKKVDDPFEDDDFFKSSSPTSVTSASNESNGKRFAPNPKGDDKTKVDTFQWDSNFAKFDENM